MKTLNSYINCQCNLLWFLFHRKTLSQYTYLYIWVRFLLVVCYTSMHKNFPNQKDMRFCFFAYFLFSINIQSIRKKQYHLVLPIIASSMIPVKKLFLSTYIIQISEMLLPVSSQFSYSNSYKENVDFLSCMIDNIIFSVSVNFTVAFTVAFWLFFWKNYFFT